jgi:hypothetical protein
MSQGKYLSLEEARKSGALKRFAKEHPSEGDVALFTRLLNEMSKTTEATEEALSAEPSESSSGTQTHRGT